MNDGFPCLTIPQTDINIFYSHWVYKIWNGSQGAFVLIFISNVADVLSVDIDDK